MAGSLKPASHQLPFIASDSRGFWRERFSHVCSSCFRQRVHCCHSSEEPLRLLIIGYNPSEHAWQSGFSYSNPSNMFWTLLANEVIHKAELAHPEHIDTLVSRPHLVGFTDVLCEAGSDAAQFGKHAIHARSTLYQRLEAHVQRVQRTFPKLPRAESEPALVAFAGKQQFKELFIPSLSKCSHGEQSSVPPGWPLQHSDIYVLPSSSGRAAMTREQRAAPYRELGEKLASVPSPRVGSVANGVAAKHEESEEAT